MAECKALRTLAVPTSGYRTGASGQEDETHLLSFTFQITSAGKRSLALTQKLSALHEAGLGFVGQLYCTHLPYLFLCLWNFFLSLVCLALNIFRGYKYYMEF